MSSSGCIIDFLTGDRRDWCDHERVSRVRVVNGRVHLKVHVVAHVITIMRLYDIGVYSIVQYHLDL